MEVGPTHNKERTNLNDDGQWRGAPTSVMFLRDVGWK